MASCQVYGNKPDTGPGQLSATAARDDVNEAQPTWLVAMAWTQDRTTYTSAIATANELETAFTAKFPGYNVVGV
ncbi:MAG: hypothetical protein HY819_18510 [Acidobacteria bacterium]|nr:hypothetical protein [Acidobacteriota bacterium]